VGGISAKPAVVDGRVVTREYLSLTVDFDHDIVDGAPAARFVQHLKELIERGDGLIDGSEEQSDRAQPSAASVTFEMPGQALLSLPNGETLVLEHTARSTVQGGSS